MVDVTQAQTEPEVLHAEAVRDMLEPAGYPVYLGENEIPDHPEFPYLCAWASPGSPIAGDERLHRYSGSIVTRHPVTIAALTPLDVLGAAARVRRLLHRQRPTITGRMCGDMFQEAGPATVPTVDPTVKGPNGLSIYVGYTAFTLSSTLAPST